MNVSAFRSSFFFFPSKNRNIYLHPKWGRHRRSSWMRLGARLLWVFGVALQMFSEMKRPFEKSISSTSGATVSDVSPQAPLLFFGSVLFCFCFCRGRSIIYLCMVLSESWSCDERNLSLPRRARARRQSWTFAPSHQSFFARCAFVFARNRKWGLLMCLSGVSPTEKKKKRNTKQQTKQKEIFK